MSHFFLKTSLREAFNKKKTNKIQKDSGRPRGWPMASGQLMNGRNEHIAPAFQQLAPVDILNRDRGRGTRQFCGARKYFYQTFNFIMHLTLVQWRHHFWLWILTLNPVCSWQGTELNVWKASYPIPSFTFKINLSKQKNSKLQILLNLSNNVWRRKLWSFPPDLNIDYNTQTHHMHVTTHHQLYYHYANKQISKYLSNLTLFHQVFGSAAIYLTPGSRLTSALLSIGGARRI